MRDEAGELGVSQGVSVPFKELSGDRGAIGFSTDLCATEARQAIDTHMPQLFLMAHYLHAVLLERYVDKSYFENVHSLTAGQLNCLFWVAMGKGTWEISKILGISENTVKFHLRKVMLNLNVPNRAAEVAKAFRLELLDF